MTTSMSTAAPTGGGPEWIVCPCNTVSDFPQVCPYHFRWWGQQPYGAWPYGMPPAYTPYTPYQPPQSPTMPLPNTAPVEAVPESKPVPLSDADVDRIARRLAEILRG